MGSVSLLRRPLKVFLCTGSYDYILEAGHKCSGEELFWKFQEISRKTPVVVFYFSKAAN